MGDFNAHSTLWGGTHTDKNGDEVEFFFITEQLMVVEQQNTNIPIPCYGLLQFY